MYTSGNFSFIFTSCWLIWIVYWVITWTWSKKTAQAEDPRINAKYRILLLLAFLFTISNTSSIAGLKYQIIPQSQSIILWGAVICMLGTAIAIWARTILGSNWSARVELKQDHKLIDRGPYRVIRHPIYTGLLMMFLGSTLSGGSLAVVLGLMFAIWSCTVKLKEEEKLLSEHFPSEYPDYKKNTWALIPFIY